MSIFSYILPYELEIHALYNKFEKITAGMLGPLWPNASKGNKSQLLPWCLSMFDRGF
jgi:hypothetical protein